MVVGGGGALPFPPFLAAPPPVAMAAGSFPSPTSCSIVKAVITNPDPSGVSGVSSAATPRRYLAISTRTAMARCCRPSSPDMRRSHMAGTAPWSTSRYTAARAQQRRVSMVVAGMAGGGAGRPGMGVGADTGSSMGSSLPSPRAVMYPRAMARPPAAAMEVALSASPSSCSLRWRSRRAAWRRANASSFPFPFPPAPPAAAGEGTGAGTGSSLSSDSRL